MMKTTATVRHNTKMALLGHVRLAILAAFAAAASSTEKMDCGDSHLCGVLALETGYGDGYYEHTEVSVHGLWPETYGYGTSKCIAPGDAAEPSIVYSCYAATSDDAVDAAHQLTFEQHEWDSHGVCAGVDDAEDFFTQICTLSAPPLARMETLREANATLQEMAADLEKAGYEVFYTDSLNSQIMLSACAPPSGNWVLAPQANFSSICGGWGDDDDDDDDVTSCEVDMYGPKCTTDDDCSDVPNCVRCASSGYCTEVPL